MPRLDELHLDEGATPQFDWDAPEQGQQPPAVYPGLYTLLFKMPDEPADWFDTQDVEMVKGNPQTKRSFLVLNCRPLVIASHASRDAEGQPVPLDASSGQPIQLPPQRVSFFRNDRMMISRAGELLRALGIRLEGDISKQIEQALQQVNGRVNFMAEIGWRTYFKNGDVTVSTHNRKKKGELPWPRTADGTPELLATNPKTNEKQYAYPEIMSIPAPHAAK